MNFASPAEMTPERKAFYSKLLLESLVPTLSTEIRIPNYSGPWVRIEWDMRPDEWEELKEVLMEHQTPFIRHLIEDGAL